MDASTVSWLLVKFSRFHSSQQCDERNAVESFGNSIAKRLTIDNKLLRIFHRNRRITVVRHSIQQTSVSFRENNHAKTFANSVPTNKQAENASFPASPCSDF